MRKWLQKIFLGKKKIIKHVARLPLKNEYMFQQTMQVGNVIQTQYLTSMLCVHYTHKLWPVQRLKIEECLHLCFVDVRTLTFPVYTYTRSIHTGQIYI